MPVPITSSKRTFSTIAGKWIDPLPGIPRDYDGVSIRNNSASSPLLVIVQEAHLPEPDPTTYDTTSQMYTVDPNSTYPFGNFADDRSRVWLRGDADAVIAGVAWPVRN